MRDRNSCLIWVLQNSDSYIATWACWISLVSKLKLIDSEISEPVPEGYLSSLELNTYLIPEFWRSKFSIKKFYSVWVDASTRRFLGAFK